VARISVVIPTRDRPGPLTDCLRALVTSFPTDAETVVVSDEGATELGPYLTPFFEPLRLRYVVGPPASPAAARNRGLAAARGSIVAFTDDDCLPRPGWVTALAAAVSSSPPRATGGTTLNAFDENPYADAAQAILDLIARHDRQAHGGERFFPSNNLAFPADILRRLGGFDESFRTAEDRDLCRRWRQAGFALQRIPEAVVEHAPSLDLLSFVRKFFAYGQGAARFHSFGAGRSLRDAVAFHLRLPALAGPVVRRRGLKRGAELTGLLVLWEVANLGGFLAASSRGASADLVGVRVNGKRPER
jgi:GT2 family glycosyltransferase